MKNVKKISVVITLLISVASTNAQRRPITGLKYKLSVAANDTTKAYILDSLSMYYMFYSDKHDSAFYYANQSVDNAFRIKDKKFLILAYARFGFYYLNTSQLNAGLNISFKGLQLAEKYNIDDYTSTLYYDISFIYYNLGDSAESMQNAVKGVASLAYNKDPFYDIPLHLFGHISNLYADGNNDSSLQYLHRLDSVVSISKERAAKDISYYYWTNFYLDKGNYPLADSVTLLGIASCTKTGDFLLKSFYVLRTILFFNQNKFREAIISAKQASGVMDLSGQQNTMKLLYNSYAKLGNKDSAFFYLKASDSARDILDYQNNIHKTQQVLFDQQLDKKETMSKNVLEKEKNKSKLILYIFLAALIFFLLFGFLQWRNNLQKKKANILLTSEKEKVETALSELKSTQAQLIQSEKMASLGELTAGIAHEIQNPLNFVNNFSEVNKELLTELSEEIDKKNFSEVKEIAKNIIENEEKINHHGKRADSIVKGMLQHSQSSSSAKEPTDINKLSDEYLRLAYHGFRAKNKEFNADFKTHFDETITKINIVPQDIARVLLNLFNNAFYSVKEKKQIANENYQPIVFVQTKKNNNNVEIKVSDNGNGIPDNIINKIFQPFFTTKPTGQGTGLGLSISYDIIKAHGGDIKVNAKENEFTEFVIYLPF